MIRLEIPGQDVLELHHAVFDLNGTLATDGMVIPGIPDRLRKLSGLLTLHVLTAGTHGNLVEMEKQLGLMFHLISHGGEKRQYIEQLDPRTVVAVGNGTNDTGMLRLAALSVAILGAEGLSRSALQVADIIVRSPLDAIDLLLSPQRLQATLRD